MSQQATLPRVSITPEIYAALDADTQIGPLVAGNVVDAYTLVALAAPVLGWVVDDAGAPVIHSPDGAQAIAVRRDGQVRAFGFPTADALDLLHSVQARFMAAALVDDVANEQNLV